MTDFCSFHPEISRIAVTNLEVKTVEDLIDIYLIWNLAMSGLNSSHGVKIDNGGAGFHSTLIGDESIASFIPEST